MEPEPDEWPQPASEGPQSLSYAQDSGLEVCTGVYGGPVEVEAQFLSVKPTVIAVDGWEDIMEVSVELAQGRVTLGSDNERTVHVGSIEATDTTSYRIRIHASGRDEAYDQMVESATERYLLLCWPAERQGAAVIKSISQTDLTMEPRPDLQAYDANEPQELKFSITGE